MRRELADIKARAAASETSLPQLVNKAATDYFNNAGPTGAPSGKRPRQFSRPDFRPPRDNNLDARKEEHYRTARLRV